MECKFYPFNTLKDYKFAGIFASYKGRWIFCKHKKRTTWEAPGGHIEEGETPLEAAKRELYEETGAACFDIEPLCDYRVRGELRGAAMTAHGQVFFAAVRSLGAIPSDSEMEKIDFFDFLPDNLTYPEFTTGLFAAAEAKKRGPEPYLYKLSKRFNIYI